MDQFVMFRKVVYSAADASHSHSGSCKGHFSLELAASGEGSSVSGPLIVTHSFHVKITLQWYFSPEKENGGTEAENLLPKGVLEMFAYGGVRAMFLGLKFHLKAIFFCLNFANMNFPLFWV